MLTACKYMGEVVRNLTNFAGKASTNFEKLDLKRAVESILLFTERQFLAGDIKVIRDFPDSACFVMGEMSLLQNAILNIVVNSKEAMPKGGKITIKLKCNKKDKRVVMEISDIGIGISKQNMKRMFEPFFTTKRDKGGSGLGLSTVHGIVRRHKGDVKIKSAEKKGTKVVIRLPAVR